MAINILLVDEHKIMRDGIKAILENHPDLRVVAEAGSGADAVRMFRSARPQLVVMDIQLRDFNGIEATSEMVRFDPDAKVVILSACDDENSMIAAIRAGARAILVKRTSESELLDALRTVARGGSYLGAQVSDRLLSRIKRGEVVKQKLGALDRLTPREMQVLRLVVDGKTSKEIAILLNLGMQTARSYRKTMMKKLGVNNAAGLTYIAYSSGLTVLPSAPERYVSHQ